MAQKLLSPLKTEKYLKKKVKDIKFSFKYIYFDTQKLLSTDCAMKHVIKLIVNFFKL